MTEIYPTFCFAFYEFFAVLTSFSRITAKVVGVQCRPPLFLASLLLLVPC
jgi:hypothetical protein